MFWLAGAYKEINNVFNSFGGRDDIRIKINGKSHMSDDSNLFLRQIEKADGDLARLKDLLLESGEVTDDLSLIRIEYKGEGSG